MSKIALIIDSFGKEKNKCMLLVARVFSCPISEIQKNLGKNVPIVQHKIFDRNFPEFPERLMALLKDLDAFGCHWRAFELLDGQAWDSSETYFEVTSERLANMVSARASSMRQQVRIASLEEGGE